MVAHRQANLLESFAAGGVEGGFLQGICFTAGEGGLSCIYVRSVSALHSSKCGRHRWWLERTIAQSARAYRQDYAQISPPIGYEQDQHRCASRERAFVVVRRWWGEGSEIRYRPLYICEICDSSVLRKW